MQNVHRAYLLVLLGLVQLLLSPAGFANGAAEVRFSVSAFNVEGENPLSAEATQRIVSPFAGSAVTIDRLQAAAAALESDLKRRGHAFLRVVVPPQDVGDVVTLRVLAFRLGTVAVRGNENFTEGNVRASLPALRPGQPPNLTEVARDQALANEHPARQVTVTMRQGVKPDTVDADIAVRDVNPLRVFGSLGNTGTGSTGDWRLSVGVQQSNLFDRDHALTASYTSSPGHWREVAQYGLFYSVPFYGMGGALSAFYSYSDVNSGTIANVFQVSGRGQFAGLRWKQYFSAVGAFSHHLEVGIEDRHFVNDVSFVGVPIGTNARSRPFAVSYAGKLDYAGGQIRGSVEYARNLGSGGDNTDAAYLANRAGARRDWSAWRLALDAQQALGHWTASLRMRGQLAGAPLLPGEQFGFGGASGVRGLREREVTGDLGVLASAEMLSPALAEGLRAVVFLDAGSTRLRQPVAGQSGRVGAASAGVGFRWAPRPGLALSLDYARVLDGAVVTAAGGDRLHFSLAMQF
ncbi:MAG: ShlB/FhaC/HecB family hemolysin secretion/activation protein [Burkholderiales bacterium]|nr:ShlB/FhaC/HecB family hemolysin secretion/activation protein [Burkholderiales bacterium]